MFIIKGFDVAEGGGIDLISQIIKRHLHIEVSVLMGANLANEIADEKFSETTIGNSIYNILLIYGKKLLLFRMPRSKSWTDSQRCNSN